MREGKICSFLSCAVSTKILRGPQGDNTANRSHKEMTANTAHVVQLGRYLMKIKAIRAEMKIKYICWRRRGPFQCTTTIPIAPKFHMHTVNVIQSIGRLYD